MASLLSIPRLIVCVTGMPGSGKSTVADIAVKMGFSIINMGDIVRDESMKRKSSLSSDDVSDMMMTLRKELGQGAIATLSLPRIISTTNDFILVDGVRSCVEIEVFKTLGRVKILSVSTPDSIRFSFLIGRGRQDLPLSTNDFDRRDSNERNIGVGDVMRIADATISNVNISIEQLSEKISSVLREWIDEVSD